MPDYFNADHYLRQRWHLRRAAAVTEVRAVIVAQTPGQACSGLSPDVETPGDVLRAGAFSGERHG